MRKIGIIPLYLLAGAAILGLLYLTSLHSYILFHSIAEIVGIAIGFGIFIFGWNTRHLVKNGYLAFLGTAYLFISVITILHALTYKGMGVFPEFGSNVPTQLWIVSRYMLGLSFLSAPYFSDKPFKPWYVFPVYSVVMVLALASIFYWHIFPACYLDGVGLTTFKKVSEYIICGILALSIVVLWRRRRYFEKVVLWLLISAFIVTMASELAFTNYITVYGPANLIGHLLSITAFYLVYQAIIVTGFKRPVESLFKDLALTNEAVESSEKKYRTIFENATEGIFQSTPDGHFISANQAFARMMGYGSPEELISQIQDIALQAYADPADRQTVLSLLEKEGRAERFETRFIKKNGEIIWVSINSQVVRDEKGALRHFEGTAHEITRRKASEEQLNKLLAELGRQRATDEATFSSVLVGMSVYDKNGRLIKMNPAAQKMLGYSKDDLSLTLRERATRQRVETPEGIPIPPEDTLPSRALRGETIADNVFVIHPADGETRWIAGNASPIRVENGEIAGAVLTLIDITERKRNEEALSKSEERLRLHSENSPLAVIEWDAHCVVTRWAGSAEKMFGWKASETIGKPVMKLGLTQVLDTSLFEPIVSGPAVSGSEPMTSTRQNVTRDGRVIWCTWHQSVLKDMQGKMLSVLSEVEDVTEHKRIDRAKDEFIGLVSHELRNPLTVIMGSVQTALTPELSAQEIRFLLENAAEGGRSMEQIITNLLELSRYQANKLKLAREDIDLKAVSQKVIDQVKLVHPMHRYVLEMADPAPRVVGDPVRIERILYNLVDNAAKYSAPESPVRIRVERKEKEASISILDRGIGIPDSRIVELFEPFQRLVEQSESTKGLGLGLVVCKRLVEAHGGSISVKSIEGHGSTFTFTLPLQAY
jgi:PAS domain S-box-containing protein